MKESLHKKNNNKMKIRLKKLQKRALFEIKFDQFGLVNCAI